MAAPHLLARFDDFSGGELGLLSPRKSPRNMWTGQNCVVFPDRSIGPRFGTVRFVASGAISDAGVHLVGWTPYGSTTFGRVWFLDYDGKVAWENVADFRSVGASWTAFTGSPVAGAGAGNAFDYWNARDARTYLVGTDTQVSRLEHDLGTVTDPIDANAPKGRAICQYGQRMFVGAASAAGGGARTVYRVRYSAAGDFTSWPDTNYFDLPYQSEILALKPQRDHMVIVQSSGHHWIYTGTPGVNENLREAASWSQVVDVNNQVEGSIASLLAQGWGRTNRGELWYAPAWRRRPTSFDGAVPRSIDHLTTQTLGSSSYTKPSPVVAGDGPDDLVIVNAGSGDTTAGSYPGGVQTLQRVDGAWTQHVLYFGKDAGTEAPGTVHAACQGPFGSVFYAVFYVAATGTECEIFWHEACPTGPPLLDNNDSGLPRNIQSTRDDYLSYGGAATGIAFESFFTTCDIDARGGGELTPHHVDVKFTAVNTGDTTNTCHFEVQVVRRDVFEQPTATGTLAPAATTAIAWDLAAASVHATVGSETQFRKRFSVNAGRVGSFAVKISEIRGVKIDEIAVYGIGEPARMP